MKTLTATIVLLLLSISMESESNAQDWANLARFTEENQAVAPGQAEVVFMGDSITEGWSALFPEFFGGKPYQNRGISGQTTGQMVIRFRQDVIDLGPKVVVILAGTNDIAQNQGPTTLRAIADNIISMAELAHANGIVPVIASVLPAFDYPWRPGLEPNNKIPLLNEMLKERAKMEGFRYLDYFAAMTDGQNGLRPELTTDGVHLTREGYESMSSMVESEIRSLWGQR